MLFRLPSAKCVVFYNGTNDIPEQNIPCLSDSYGYKTENSPDTYPGTYLNLKVLVSNLNGCYNEDIKRNCRTLTDHQTYVSFIMEYAEKLPIEEAWACGQLTSCDKICISYENNIDKLKLNTYGGREKMLDKNNNDLEKISNSLYSMDFDTLTCAENRVRAYHDGMHEIINRHTADPDENKPEDYSVFFK